MRRGRSPRAQGEQHIVGLEMAVSVIAPGAFDVVRTAAPGTGIAVGGRGVDDRVATSWDVALCRHITEAVEQVDGPVTRARHN